MQKYSDFFKTLHDETCPTGHLGRGTHYSVLRAVVFHDPTGEPLPEGRFTDFAVIWDEDHDTRVFEPIEEVYRRGLLSSFLMFGERKGFFTAVLPSGILFRRSSERAAFLGAQINEICQSLDDPWPSEVTAIGSKRNPIISDDDDKVTLYLQNLQMLWQLGSVVRGPKRSPSVADGTLAGWTSDPLEADKAMEIFDDVQEAVTKYNFKAKGELHRLEVHSVQLGKKMPSPRMVFQGSVADLIKKVMAKREPDRLLYSITIGPDFGMDASALRYRDIEQLYNNPAFPKE